MNSTLPISVMRILRHIRGAGSCVIPRTQRWRNDYAVCWFFKLRASEMSRAGDPVHAIKPVVPWVSLARCGDGLVISNSRGSIIFSPTVVCSIQQNKNTLRFLSSPWHFDAISVVLNFTLIKPVLLIRGVVN